MRLFHLARYPTRAIRIALFAMLLALGLNAIAAGSHHHEDDLVGTSTSAHPLGACGYCATFGALGGSPSPIVIQSSQPSLVFVATALVAVAIVRRIATSAIPRGPPRF